MKVVVNVHSKTTVNLFHGKLVVKKTGEMAPKPFRTLWSYPYKTQKNSVIRIIPQSL